jgi:hypothetical protein
MDKYDIYIQMFGVVWVIGGSLFVIKTLDRIAIWNARFGIKINARFSRIFFTLTLLLGILGAINLALEIIGKSGS